MDFLLGGGDDFKTVIDNKVYVPREVHTIGNQKELLKPILKGMEIIKEGTLIDPDSPRIILV